jgi:hypothetical protein
MKPTILSYGYLEDFKGNPTLLFLGDPSLGLVAVIEQMQIAPLGTRIEIDELSQLCPRRGTKVSFTVAVSPSVRINRQKDKTGYEIDLEMTLEMVSEFLRLARIVGSSPVPCHHYFDISANRNLTILISKDEYDGGTFQWKE